MASIYRKAAEEAIQKLERRLLDSPPAGTTRDAVHSFFARLGGSLVELLSRLVEERHGPGRDRKQRGHWHELTADSLREALVAAATGTAGDVSWWLTRVRVHRPDLMPAAEAWASSRRLVVPPPIRLDQPIPADDGGQLLIYELPADQVGQIAGALGREEFRRFAILAYLSNDVPSGILLDVAAGWFGRPEVAAMVAAAPDDTQQRLGEFDPSLGDPAAEMDARLKLLQAAGEPIPERAQTAATRRTIDPSRAPTPQELLEAMEADRDLTGVKERTEANVAAVEVLDAPSSDYRRDFRRLMRYSGYGGLSIEAVKDRLNPMWVPSQDALIHEYYTPTRLALEIARAIRPWVSALPHRPDGFISGLEPSAGIGRLLNAASTPGFEQVRWTAVESSVVSATILQTMRPDITISVSSFEEWINLYEETVAGQLGLVLCNPPYGERGASFAQDRNPAYRERAAYHYFLRRCLDLLAAGGIGVFLIPAGFMTGIKLAGLREQVLRRHHLRAAFRLPSDLFPGAKLVIDLLFFESRGGELPAVLPGDLFIVDGKYFERTPAHILGKEVGTGNEDDAEGGARSRWGYQVEGEFSELPPFDPRLRCDTCAVHPYGTPRLSVQRRLAVAEQPPHVQAAITLGSRVATYLALLAAGEHTKTGRAAALQPELFEALVAWRHNIGDRRNPWEDRALQARSSDFAEIVSFLSAFGEDGEVVPQIANRPTWEPRFEGSQEDIAAQAEWLYSVKRELTLEQLTEFRRTLGIFTLDPLHTHLIKAGWCFDDGRWLPERDYYSGLLWDRWARARQLARAGDEQAAAQFARLDPLLKTARIDEIDPEPRMPWVPIAVTGAWFERWTGKTPPAPLEWRDGLLQLTGLSYHELPEDSARLCLGYINHDLTYFSPPYQQLVDPVTGDEERASEALDRVRLEYANRAKRDFVDMLAASPELTSEVEAAYNKLFRGYVVPEYSSEPLEIARWDSNRIRLKAHQARGARRLLANNGGLLGFDVGVGKTYTGIAVIAKLREQGRARRPVVVVPNTIIWKWYKEFLKALPDYRVVVIGSNRYVGRNGTFASKLDTAEERSLKWRQFQAGEFDVALVTFSMLGRTAVRAESFSEWVYETPVVVRKLGLEARALARIVEDDPDEVRKPKITEAMMIKAVGEAGFQGMSISERQALSERLATEKQAAKREEIDRLLAVVEGLSNLSERERAIFSVALQRWVAERVEANRDPDPGIYWEELGCDCLLVDEAQNFKNLWPVGMREGGIPKYLGAINEGSERAWSLAIRAFLVRKKNGGSGVYLLSATPAKNSPLEYFTLLGYVDANAWARLGILDPEVFIDRYLRLEMRQVLSPDLKVAMKSVVAGFRNLDELRSVIFRFAEFRTAEEVGIPLPELVSDRIFLPMDERQREVYAVLVEMYTDALKRISVDPRAKMAALGLLQRMALTAIHGELPLGPRRGAVDIQEALREPVKWTWKNATEVRNPHCPKLDKVAGLIMQRPDCGHLVFCDNVAVHRWLVMILVEAGFPQDRIAVLNGDQAKDPAKRQLIAERFNGSPAIIGDDGTIEQEAIAPDYDVVIANATAYEGIDLHVRTCFAYNIDLPWEPATLQQRAGRAVRQGNTSAVIGILYLLSERSLDAIRLNMILGKLGWMRDILASADRETNNPAAQADLSPEELVLMLATDPEEAKAAFAEQKRLQAEQQQRRVADNAWTTFRGLISRVGLLSRLNDPDDQAGARRDADALVGRLRQIPSTVWPWHWLIERAQAGVPLALVAGLAFPPDWFAMVPGGDLPVSRGIAIGQVFPDALGIRLFGSHRFERVRYERIDTSQPSAFEANVQAVIRLLTPEMVAAGAKGWDLAKDRELWRATFAAALRALPETGSWDELGISASGREWRRELLDSHWPEIARGILSAPELPFGLPILKGSESLTLGRGLEGLSADQLMPFDFESWPEFLRRAAVSGERWSDLNDTSLAWWGKPFPRGIIRAADERQADIEVMTVDGMRSVKPLYRKAALAITMSVTEGIDHPNGPRYVLTHIPSGMGVLTGFRSAEAARAALEYALREKAVDWSAKRLQLNKAPASLYAGLSRIREEDRAIDVSEL